MMDDIGDIVDYYNNDPEREDNRLERHQLEYDLTWRYLDQYLPSQGSILEIGAGPGRYTLELARRGYNITAVDMSVGLIEISRQRIVKATLGKQVQYVLGDARDLHAVTERNFDAVLLMGPFYHLVEEADRKAALQQASERLRTGGILFSAFISRFGIMGDLMRNVPEWVENRSEVQNILQLGKNPEHIPGSGFRGYFARVSEITPLHEEMGFQTLTLAGVEPGIASEDGDHSYNILQGEQRRLWLDLFHTISTEPSILGASRHILYIGRKR